MTQTETALQLEGQKHTFTPGEIRFFKVIKY